MTSFLYSPSRYWCNEFEEQLSEMIANLLTSRYENSSPNKRKRALKNSSTQNTAPTSDQVCHKTKCIVFHFQLSIRFSYFSCSATWNIFEEVVAMEMALVPAYMFITKCKEHYNKHSQTAVIAQRSVSDKFQIYLSFGTINWNFCSLFRNNTQTYSLWLLRMRQVEWVAVAQAVVDENLHQLKKKLIQTAATKKIQNQYIILVTNLVM